MLAMISRDLRRQNSAKAHVTCNSFTSRVFQAAASATVVKLSSPRWRELDSCHLILLALCAVATARDSGTLVARRFVMKIHRWWIGILVVGGAIACGLALVFVAIGVIAGTTVEASGEATVAPSVTSVSQSVTSPADASLNSTSQSAAVQNASEQTYEGMVTCSRCGGRHPAKSHQTAAQCSLTCVRGGSGFTLVDGEALYQLDGDREIIKHYVGQRAQVAGLAQGNTIRVSSITQP